MWRSLQGKRHPMKSKVEKRAKKFIVIDFLINSPILAESLYNTAMGYFNKSKSDKTAGFVLLHKAADKGHKLAKVQIAWAHLLGVRRPDIGVQN